jgi:hypothetical protein
MFWCELLRDRNQALKCFTKAKKPKAQLNREKKGRALPTSPPNIGAIS